MLKKVISQKTSIPDLEYYNKSFTLKKSLQNSPKSNISNIPSNKYSIDDLSQICNKNTKSIFNKIKNKTNNKYYPFNSYKYKMKKSANFSNDNINNNISNNTNTIKIKKLSTVSQNVSPLKKQNINYIFPSYIYPNNNPINKTEKRKRKISIDENRNNKENNNGIKVIKIKSKKKLSQVLSYCNKTININDNNNNDDNNKTFSIYKIGNLEDNNNQNNIKNIKKIAGTPKAGIYSKKRLKGFKSLSMDKKLNDSIKSIEINFSLKTYGNNFIDTKEFNSYKLAKILLIQKQFRKYLEIKIRNKIIFAEKILKGVIFLKKYILKNHSEFIQKFFSIYKLRKQSREKLSVKEEQYELLKVLKRKNILDMKDLKKYIIGLLNNNKIELF